MNNIDNNSLKILSFLYNSDSKTVREIINEFTLHTEVRREYIDSLLLQFQLFLR